MEKEIKVLQSLGGNGLRRNINVKSGVRMQLREGQKHPGNKKGERCKPGVTQVLSMGPSVMEGTREASVTKICVDSAKFTIDLGATKRGRSTVQDNQPSTHSHPYPPSKILTDPSQGNTHTLQASDRIKHSFLPHRIKRTQDPAVFTKTDD